MGITEYILRRLVIMIPTLLGVLLFVFLMLHLTPGDPVALIIGLDQYTQERAAQVREELGLNDPLHVQYLRYVTRAVQGDFGQSIRLNRPALEVVLERFPATIELTLVSLFIALCIALPVGVIAAVRRYSLVDNLSMTAAMMGVAMPNFWLGLVLIMVFSLNIGWLPPSGRHMPLITALYDAFTSGEWADLALTVRHLILPAVTMGTAIAALLTRLVRSSMLEVLQQDFIITARTKGLPESQVLFRHALKNALIPVVTVIGLQLGALMGGSIITETIFSWPGVGRMVVNAIFTRDFPVVQTAVLLIACVFVLINLLVDVFYAVIDPRIRYG